MGLRIKGFKGLRVEMFKGLGLRVWLMQFSVQVSEGFI